MTSISKPLLPHTGSFVTNEIISVILTQQLTPTIAASASTTFNSLVQQLNEKEEKVLKLFKCVGD